MMLYLSLSAESSVVCVVIIVDRLSLLFSEMRERGSPKNSRVQMSQLSLSMCSAVCSIKTSPSFTEGQKKDKYSIFFLY